MDKKLKELGCGGYGCQKCGKCINHEAHLESNAQRGFVHLGLVGGAALVAGAFGGVPGAVVGAGIGEKAACELCKGINGVCKCKK